MLEKFIPHLIDDLELGKVSLTTEIPGVYSLPLDEDLSVKISETSSGIIFKCSLAPCPKIRQEEFLTQAMLANLFGQGTRDAILGLAPDREFVTLTHPIDYSIDYKEFKEILEDFINTIDFWRNEISSYK